MSSTDCRWVEKFGDHGYVVIYERPWRNFFRKVYVLRCWTCDFREPFTRS